MGGRARNEARRLWEDSGPADCVREDPAGTQSPRVARWAWLFSPTRAPGASIWRCYGEKSGSGMRQWRRSGSEGGRGSR